MAKVPAYCEHCGTTFYVENFIGGSGATRLTLTGNRTNCPRCGNTAKFVDGVFNLKNDELHLIDGPPLTQAMMASLQGIVEKAKNETLTADELISEVAGVSPELAEKIRKKGLGPFVIVLLLIWLLHSCQLNLTVDLNELMDQAQGVEQTEDADDFLNTPLPENIKAETPKPTFAATEKSTPSRQVRRQMERQAKKRDKGRNS